MGGYHYWPEGPRKAGDAEAETQLPPLTVPPRRRTTPVPDDWPTDQELVRHDRHIFGAGGCWCGYNQHAYQSGGLNHLQAAAARDLLIAADRMRDRWAEGDDAVKRQLWQDLHTKADVLRAALDLPAAQEEDA